jgi:hypothetical protein
MVVSFIKDYERRAAAIAADVEIAGLEGEEMGREETCSGTCVAM